MSDKNCCGGNAGCGTTACCSGKKVGLLLVILAAVAGVAFWAMRGGETPVQEQVQISEQTPSSPVSNTEPVGNLSTATGDAATAAAGAAADAVKAEEPSGVVDMSHQDADVGAGAPAAEGTAGEADTSAEAPVTTKTPVNETTTAPVAPVQQ